MQRNNYLQNEGARDTPDRAPKAPELPWNAA
jgi:hypothetical protein